MHAHAAPSGLQGHPNAGQAVSTGPAAALPLPLAREGLATTHGPGVPPRYHPQVGASSRTAWHVEHYGAAFRMAAPEEYVPHMMDQGRAHEDEQGSLPAQAGGTRHQKLSSSRSPGKAPSATLEATIIGYH